MTRAPPHIPWIAGVKPHGNTLRLLEEEKGWSNWKRGGPWVSYSCGPFTHLLCLQIDPSRRVLVLTTQLDGLEEMGLPFKRVFFILTEGGTSLMNS